ncbi:MAG TPA: ABC transporter permease [Rhizomicrobium sp.]|nr:ABC transporter permease [Rhizomicrobium sp.]
MFRNYLTIALRNIIRHKLYSFINIAGLAVGLTCVILIVLFVRDELSYDRWIPGSDHLYRVEVTYYPPGRPAVPLAQTAMPVPIAMRDNIPEVRDATRLAKENMAITVGDRHFSEIVAVVDPNFLQVIPLPLISGDPRTVLAHPESVVLTQSMARKYFGDADPIGRTISPLKPACAPGAASCDNSTVPLKVTGVLRDLPHNTQLYVDMLVPNTSVVDRIDQEAKHNWLSNNGTYGYVKLAPGADPAQVVAKTKPMIDRSADLSRYVNLKVPGSQIMQVRLVPFRDAHLTTDQYFGMKPAGSWTTLYGMGAIGFLILLVACFNFMNLATARATMRAREISLRKCVGARRGQLMAQFLGESVLTALVALVLALALVEVALPFYGSFLQVPLSLNYLAEWPLMLGFVATAVLAGLLGGFYPALVISGFRPAAALRANTSANPGSGALRTTLVVLQFAVSIGLGIAATVVFHQIDFARHMDLGFRRDNIVITSTNRLSATGMKAFAEALARGPGIVSVARSSFTAFNGNTGNVLPVQKPGDPQAFFPTHLAVSPDYFQVYGIKILAGRGFSANRGEDVFSYFTSGPSEGSGDPAKNEGHNVMVNALMAHALGYAPQDIIGKTFIFGKARMKVVGVTANTLTEGARTAAFPMVYVYAPDWPANISMRIDPARTQEAMAYIERTFHSFVPNVPVSHAFLDDSFERLYSADKKQGAMFAVFVGIAIVIACMGLFGLAAFTAGRRTREIGIRKVFGARIRDVVFLLLWQFSIPVLIANLIAWPVAWYYLHGWLQGFAYRIALSPLYFLGAGLMALLIAWATVFSHARRVAGANPINALRYE